MSTARHGRDHTGPVERALRRRPEHGNAADIGPGVDRRPHQEGHQKTNEQLMELEKRIQGRPTSQHPVFPTMKKEVLGHMAAEERLLYPLLEREMRDKVQEAIKEHNEVRQHLEHLTAGNMPRTSGHATFRCSSRDPAPRPGRGEPGAPRGAADRRRPETPRARAAVQADGRAAGVGSRPGGCSRAVACARRLHHFSTPSPPTAGIVMWARR